MTQAEPALPAAEAASVPAPFEWETVSTASCKMLEVQRETAPNVVAAVPAFLNQVAANYGVHPTMYGAMQLVPAALLGLGPVPDDPAYYGTLHHAMGAQSFYQNNILSSWKEWMAAQLGVDPSSPEVYAAWAQQVTNGTEIPAEMVDTGSTAVLAAHWWSPDARLEVPSSSSFEQGNSDFFLACRVVSLAPEWYPYGLVRINWTPPAQGVVRPVSLDGMTSPLWVQRPPDHPARTGDAALETLNKDPVLVSDLAPSQAYIVTAALAAALKVSPSVVEYSPDLDKVQPGATPETQALAEQEAIIVRECRVSRRRANAAFRQLIESGELPAPGRITGTPPALPHPPEGVGRTEFHSFAELKQELEAWGRGGFTRHRGDRFPHERWNAEAAKSPESRRAVLDAAAQLLRESADPGVLRMAANLLPGADHRPFYQALLHRLEGGGPALPEIHGLRTATLRGDLLERLREKPVAVDPDLAARAHALLQREGRPALRLALLAHADPRGELAQVLGDAVTAGIADPWLVGLAARRLAERDPDRVLPAALRVAALAPEARHRFFAGVQQGAASWHQQHQNELARALSISVGE